MKIINVIILSGACCNPQLSIIDTKVQARLKEIAKKKQLQINIRIISISSAAVGGLGIGEEIDETVRDLVTSKGMSVLPVVIFDKVIAFYGGLASTDIIIEKLNFLIQT